MVHVLSRENSLLHHFIAEVRDKEIQKDRMRFRRNLERIGEIFAYEISKKMTYQPCPVETPLGGTEIPLLREQPVIATILRAGIPLYQGMLSYFDRADSAFVSAYRKARKNEDKFDIKVEYMATPSLDGRELIICDPMLASGSSMILVYKGLLQYGKPKHVHIVSTIGSNEGLEKVKRSLPENVSFWLGALDEELTAGAYIVPGLGDAGDLAYGAKESPEE